MGYLKSISKFLVAGALFSSLFVTSAFASNLGKVTGDVVNLRSYNSTAGQLVSVAKKNDVLTIVANANNGWFEVTTGPASCAAAQRFRSRGIPARARARHSKNSYA